MSLKVHKSELNSSTIQSLLDSEIQDTENLITTINSFINNTKPTLTSEAYDTARSEMESYVKILEKRKLTASALKSAISNGTSSLSDYMGSYDYLDDSDLAILKSEINNIQASYDAMKNSYYQRYNNNFITRIYMNWAISSLNKQCANQIAPIQEEIDKIEGLGAADATAYSLLTAATADTDSYKGAITGK